MKNQMLCVLLGLGVAGAAFSQDAGGKNAADKRVPFAMREQPWPKVFEWLSDHSGLPLIAKAGVPGSFSIVSPQNKTHTFDEIFDLVNQVLLQHNFLLLRTDQALVLVPADERIDPSLCPIVTAEELRTRPRTALVRMILPLPADKDALASLKRLLGTFGEATVLGDRVVLCGPAANLSAIVELLQFVQKAPLASRSEINVITLNALDAAPTARILRGLSSSGGPLIEADSERNTLLIKGTKEQVAEIKSLLPILGETAAPHVFTLDEGNAATLAEALQKLLSQMRSNPVRVIQPAQPGKPEPKAKEPQKESSSGGGKAPITLTAFGNRLIVTSDDLEALALVRELVRRLKHAQSGDFEIIRLRNAVATDAARVLDEAFNGKALNGPERIRVVAEPVTNTLLVKASPLDMHSIRRLLAAGLDADDTASAAPTSIWMIRLKHATALDMAKVLDNIFGEDKTVRISADQRSNSLVIRSSEPVAVEIRRLVTELDDR